MHKHVLTSILILAAYQATSNSLSDAGGEYNIIINYAEEIMHFEFCAVLLCNNKFVNSIFCLWYNRKNMTSITITCATAVFPANDITAE